MKCSANVKTCLGYKNGECHSFENCMHKKDDYVDSVVDAIKFLDEFSSYNPYQEAWEKVCSFYGIEY